MATDYCKEQLSLFQEAFKKINKDGIDLYYNGKRTGTSINGLSRLIGCNKKTIFSIVERCYPNATKNLETITDGGLQGVTLIDEADIPNILQAIIEGKRTSKENKDKAQKVLFKLAQAGFRLFALLEIAPETVAVEAINRVKDTKSAKKVKEHAENHVKYLESYHGEMGELKSCGAEGKHYAIVNAHNNKLVGLKKGQRPSMGDTQKDELTMIQLAEKMALRAKRESNSIHCADHAVAVAKSVGNRTKGYIDQLLTAN